MRIDWEEYATDDFLRLDRELDEYYRATFGAQADKYRPYASYESATDFFIAYEGGMPVAIAAFKPYPERGAAELKRVFVKEAFRRLGVGSRVVDKVEESMKRKGYARVKIETGAGKDNFAAQEFYKKRGYLTVKGWGAFADDPAVVCMEKEL